MAFWICHKNDIIYNRENRLNCLIILKYENECSVKNAYRKFTVATESTNKWTVEKIQPCRSVED